MARKGRTGHGLLRNGLCGGRGSYSFVARLSCGGGKES